jgi:hypothetical protein
MIIFVFSGHYVLINFGTSNTSVTVILKHTKFLLRTSEQMQPDGERLRLPRIFPLLCQLRKNFQRTIEYSGN